MVIGRDKEKILNMSEKYDCKYAIIDLNNPIPQREFIETGYDPTASNRSRICSTTSTDNNVIQSDANIDPEKTPGKGMYYCFLFL